MWKQEEGHLFHSSQAWMLCLIALCSIQRFVLAGLPGFARFTRNEFLRLWKFEVIKFVVACFHDISEREREREKGVGSGRKRFIYNGYICVYKNEHVLKCMYIVFICSIFVCMNDFHTCILYKKKIHKCWKF